MTIIFTIQNIQGSGLDWKLCHYRMNPSIVGSWWIVFRPSCGCCPADTVAVVLPPQSSKSLLLGVLVDICSNDEGHEVEERYPGLLGQELLGKRQADW